MRGWAQLRPTRCHRKLIETAGFSQQPTLFHHYESQLHLPKPNAPRRHLPPGIPNNTPQSVTIPETHRPALIAWLRSLTGKSSSVRFTWETPGQLTLTHRDYDTLGATIQVPVIVDGQPPEIAFDPKHLADAIEIGPTFRLVDKLNPGMATGPSGNFCVLMSLRFTEEAVTVETARETPTPAIAA